MAEEWIVRVDGKEYGPVDLDELRGWKEEGRLIRENEIREPGSERWLPAAQLPELFADEPVPPTTAAGAATLDRLLVQTWQIYRARFGQFLALSALILVPSLCAQLSSAAVAGGGGEINLRAALAALFNLAMLVAGLVAWPIYIASLQILTSETAHGRSIPLAALVSRAVNYWPRVALLCLLVYGAFFLLLVLAFAILLLVATGPPSLVTVLVSLALLAFQVWMFGRVFVAVLFWQQATVLENAGVVDSLRRSKELARSRRDLPWWRRPLWHAVVLSSLWCLLATALSLGTEWSTVTAYFHALMTTQDPQAIVQSMQTMSVKSHPLTSWTLALGVLQTVLRPLLGIGFVLIYLDLQKDS